MTTSQIVKLIGSIGSQRSHRGNATDPPRSGYNRVTMSSPGELYKPYEKLVQISLRGKIVEVPEGNMLLRALQFLSPENVAMGRFCWNEECQYCRITYDMGEGTKQHQALSCKLMVQPGMRVVEMAQEIRYCLREVGIPK